MLPPLPNPFLNDDSTVRSLNRAHIASLPASLEADDVVGRTGYDLLSAASLHSQIRAAGGRLALDPTAQDLVRRLDACFDDPHRRPYAVAIARDYGYRLGCLLLMLHQGDPANRAARPGWSSAHWDFWESVRRVYAGGGLLAGRLGELAVEAANDVLTAAGVTDLVLSRAPHGSYLALVGLARCLPQGTTAGVVFDSGHTAVKRGVAEYERGRLVRLTPWPDVVTVCTEPNPLDQSDELIRSRWRAMADLVAERWNAAPARCQASGAVGLSLACYLLGGHPSPRDQGCYGSLQRLGPHLTKFVTDELAGRLGRTIPVTLLHDGAAAAAVYAGQERAVVITLGTSIGNGFPPAAARVRPMAEDFVLHAVTGR